MELNWENIPVIARSLDETFPMTDRLHLSLSGLREMLSGLPDSGKEAARDADDDLLRAILTAWMNIEEDGDPDQRDPFA
jgi:FeS assembly protein IscX